MGQHAKQIYTVRNRLFARQTGRNSEKMSPGSRQIRLVCCRESTRMRRKEQLAERGVQ
jgi:hypothetical protein